MGRQTAVLTIEAGSGTPVAQSWVEALHSMYLEWASTNGHEVQVSGQPLGLDVGMRRTVITITGERAYDYLRFEQGVHKTQYMFNHRLYIAFALVTVREEGEQEDRTSIDLNDPIRTYVSYPYQGVFDRRLKGNLTERGRKVAHDGDLNFIMEACLALEEGR